MSLILMLCFHGLFLVGRKFVPVACPILSGKVDMAPTVAIRREVKKIAQLRMGKQNQKLSEGNIPLRGGVHEVSWLKSWRAATRQAR